KDQDLPRRVPATTQQQLHRAERAGRNIGALCRDMHDRQGPMALRRILGVLSLVKKYGPAVVDEACSAGLELGVCEYHFVRRYLVFDLASGAFISRREDALFLGPGGSGKSHLAQAIGQAAIQQGYRVLYRETHVLLDQLAEAVIDGTRKEFMDTLSTVPLLII